MGIIYIESKHNHEHSHDFDVNLILISGNAKLLMDCKWTKLMKGVNYIIPKDTSHDIYNFGNEECLVECREIIKNEYLSRDNRFI